MRTIFITGASSGIGLATARYFHEKGWQVIATSRNLEKLQANLNTDKRLALLKMDVTDVEAITQTVTKAIDMFGSVDVIVNNAGYGLAGPFDTTNHEQIRQQFETNVFGLIDVTNAFMPHFRERNSGTIINISSMFGRISLPFYSYYSASKWAVEGYSEAIRYELRGTDIKIKIIEPGAVKTKFFENTKKASDTEKSLLKNYFSSVFRTTSNKGKRGAEPIVVARTIERAINSRARKLRFVPDKTAKSLLTLRRFTPLNIFQYLIAKNVK